MGNPKDEREFYRVIITPRKSWPDNMFGWLNETVSFTAELFYDLLFITAELFYDLLFIMTDLCFDVI